MTSLPISRATARAMIIGLVENKLLSPITETKVPIPSIKKAAKNVIKIKNMQKPYKNNSDISSMSSAIRRISSSIVLEYLSSPNLKLGVQRRGATNT